VRTTREVASRVSIRVTQGDAVFAAPLRRRALGASAALLLVGGAIGASSVRSAASVSPKVKSHVLLVGTFHGVKGGYATIQSAVNAAKPGDWILVAPGDYHETDDLTSPPKSYAQAGFGAVLITTPRLHLRGMSRSGVIVDGTRPGAPACSSNPSDQEYGNVVGGSPVGRNGIVVFKANDVYVENLTVCNFLSGSQGSGNGVWWNGGDATGKIGLTGYWGSYLTATSTFFATESAAATYGIFSSNAAGPASWNQIYANNQNDSGIYVGACKQVCNVTISHAWMEYNALGYSGTNSGGAIVITHSQFDNNQDGLDTNTAISGDPTAPQNGACPKGGISKITHTHSCWVLMDSFIHDNNNANAPESGSAGLGPTGTGMTLSGGRNDTILHDTFANNGAWGILFVPYPDSGTPVDGQSCKGSSGHVFGNLGCILDPQNDALVGNTFTHDGFFGNPTNSDFGELTLSRHLTDCFSKNHAPDGSYPTNLATAEKSCTGKMVNGNATTTGASLYAQVLCDTRIDTSQCTPGSHYPPRGTVVMHPVPALPSMPNPCKGAPPNPWCKAGSPI
jgi:hypothetical protein